MISLRLYALVLVAGAVLAVAYFLLRRKPKTAEDLERERRAWLDRIGRITDGTVIDVQEMAGTREQPSTFLIYQYDVAGVSYEASQDVTYLRQLINLHSCRLGLPTSVRYDPHNPGNSIVLSERWMGLRQQTGQWVIQEFLDPTHDGVILSLRRIQRAADLDLHTEDGFPSVIPAVFHQPIVVVRARSFGTEVPQDDARVCRFFQTDPLPPLNPL